MTPIIACYRHQDRIHAQRIVDHLGGIYGEENIFSATEKSVSQINHELLTCHVLLVIMGPEWIDCLDHSAGERDYVQGVTAYALRTPAIEVLMVRVNEANWPLRYELPAIIQELELVRGITISDYAFEYNIMELIHAIDLVPGIHHIVNDQLALMFGFNEQDLINNRKRRRSPRQQGRQWSIALGVPLAYGCLCGVPTAVIVDRLPTGLLETSVLGITLLFSAFILFFLILSASQALAPLKRIIGPVDVIMKRNVHVIIDNRTFSLQTLEFYYSHKTGTEPRLNIPQSEIDRLYGRLFTAYCSGGEMLSLEIANADDYQRYYQQKVDEKGHDGQSLHAEQRHPCSDVESFTGGIYVSYRPDDADIEALQLARFLAGRLNTQSVFIRQPENGTNWREAMSRALVVVVVIGPDWLGVPPYGAAWRSPVRDELTMAFQNNKVVVPMLAANAAWISATQLPIELQQLATLNALPLYLHTVAFAVDQITDLLHNLRQNSKLAPPRR